MTDTLETLDFQATLDHLVLVHETTKLLPVDKLISAIASADSAGPLLNPTLWIHGNERMGICREALAAAREFNQAMEKFRARMAETAPAAARSMELLRGGVPA